VVENEVAEKSSQELGEKGCILSHAKKIPTGVLDDRSPKAYQDRSPLRYPTYDRWHLDSGEKSEQNSE